MTTAMDPLAVVGFLLTGLLAGLLAFAAQVSESLVRSRARRLPLTLSPRMEEEWLAELGAMPGRVSRLAFAIALALTRRHSFAIDEESLLAAGSRPSMAVETFGGWASVITALTLVFAAIAYSATFFIQPLYRSTTLIVVVPQRIPESYVRPTVTSRIEDRFSTVRQQIMSRRKLEGLMTELNLYAEERKTALMEDIIERLRREIQVQSLGDSFQVSFTGTDPRTVQKVADRVATMFIDESLRDRESVAQSTDQFLIASLDDVRRRLEQHDQKVAAAKASGGVTGALTIEAQVLEESYRALFAKREESKISANVERRQIGEQFRVRDPARMPETPFSPNRPLIAGEGAVAGFLLGITMMLAGRVGAFRRRDKRPTRAEA